MVNTRLGELLQALKEEEWSGLHSYLKGLYSGKQEILKLFSYLNRCRKKHPWTSGKFEMSTMQRMLAPTLKRTSFQNRLYILADILEEYLCWQHVKMGTRSVFKDKLLIEIYEDRNLNALLKQNLENIWSTYSNNVSQGPSIFLNKMEVAVKAYYYSSAAEKYSIDNSWLNEANTSLELFFITNRLKFLCDAVVKEKVVGEGYRSTPLPDLIDLHGNSNPLIHCYQLLISSMTAETAETFDKAKLFFEKKYQVFEKKEQQVILLHLINVAAALIRKTQDPSLYRIKLLELFKLGIHNQLFFAGPYISPITFNNIVDTACKAGDLTFAKEFIHQYQKHLSPADQKDTLLIAKAGVLFAQKKYHEVILELKHEKFTSLNHDLRKRSYLLCCIVETSDDDDEVIKRINSFSRFVGNRDLNEVSYIQAYRNFGNLLRRIYFKETDKAMIEQEINAAENLFLQSWLLQRLDKYKKHL